MYTNHALLLCNRVVKTKPEMLDVFRKNGCFSFYQLELNKPLSI